MRVSIRIRLKFVARGPMPRVGRKFRILDYYMVAEAGAQIGLSRAGSYRAAAAGDIPQHHVFPIWPFKFSRFATVWIWDHGHGRFHH